jgi:2,4-dienoyl-CoA reductase-like NADH-dependent reductase (Old Yellow Enzyme family)
MTLDTSPLFTPLQIAHKTVRNRIVMPPMVVNRDLAGETGDAARSGRAWYGRRAQGGVGLVIVEATNVVDFGDRYTADNLHPLVDAIHAGGALAAIQLYPGVRGQATTPAQMTLEQIDGLVDHYRVAAEVCAQAGFDGIEPHGAHGYLLNQFYSPQQNARTDAYGGDRAGRMRLALRIVDTVRPIVLGAGMILLYRHTPVGKGYGIKASLVLAEALVQAGVDVLDLSPSSHAAPGDRAAPFMALGVPVIAVNGLDRAERALEVLREGRASLVAVGRGLIADPDWPRKVREGRLDEIVACVQCDGCHEDLRAGIPVGCSQW